MSFCKRWYYDKHILFVTFDGMVPIKSISEPLVNNSCYAVNSNTEHVLWYKNCLKIHSVFVSTCTRLHEK